jgi:hypothetical protein
MIAQSWLRTARKTVAKWLAPESVDSTQIGIMCEDTFTPNIFVGEKPVLPQISGLTRVYKGFKPTKAVLSQYVTTVWSAEGLPDLTLYETVTNADDLVLIQAFSGDSECFPSTIGDSNGIAGATFAPSVIGNGISWPNIEPRTDVTVAFAIEPTILSRATGKCSICNAYNALPAAYGHLPKRFTVKARLNLLGPVLR